MFNNNGRSPDARSVTEREWFAQAPRERAER